MGLHSVFMGGLLFSIFTVVISIVLIIVIKLPAKLILKKDISGFKICRNVALTFFSTFVILASIKIYYEMMTDWNPQIRTSHLVGTWQNSTSTLILVEGGSLIYQTSSGDFEGDWSNNDYNIDFSDSLDGLSYLRAVEYRGEIILTRYATGDPDSWSLYDSFERVND